ncbi:hypothetical protein [Tropicimonas marinistellae]|uniref:hypothetical protein n=1 Tax=Tropicimonas marinistellae TaxID=1739787 RepID=UPI000832295D|nr:hypothetical protein [Tropicimonas marinistellae]
MLISHAAARVCAVLCLIAISLPASAEEKQGLGRLLRASTKAPTAIEEGLVARACGTRGKALGKKVESGPGRFNLYDTAPGSTAARDFYVTGFKDGCPRRITGAVAMFGSVELYELVHYGPVGVKPDSDTTDKAYAKLRAKVCGGETRPCSDRGIRRLEKSAAFLNVYKSKQGSARLELLMTRGNLTAVAQK